MAEAGSGAEAGSAEEDSAVVDSVEEDSGAAEGSVGADWAGED